MARYIPPEPEIKEEWIVWEGYITGPLDEPITWIATYDNEYDAIKAVEKLHKEGRTVGTIQSLIEPPVPGPEAARVYHHILSDDVDDDYIL